MRGLIRYERTRGTDCRIDQRLKIARTALKGFDEGQADRSELLANP